MRNKQMPSVMNGHNCTPIHLAYWKNTVCPIKILKLCAFLCYRSQDIIAYKLYWKLLKSCNYIIASSVYCMILDCRLLLDQLDQFPIQLTA